MAFCSNCGTKNKDGVKFCAKCGTPMAGAVPAAPTQTAAPAAPPAKNVTVGQVKKCPSCGAEIGSFQAKCPSCGHEFSSVGVSGVVKDFADKIVGFESRNQSWEVTNSLKTRGMVMGVLAGISGVILFFCVIASWDESVGAHYEFFFGALGVTALCALIMFGKTTLSQTAKQETAFIETFPVPSSREDLFEFLILVSSRMNSANGLDYAAQLQRHWNKVWNVKCKQIKAKADLAFLGDAQSMSTVENIVTKSNKLIAQQQAHSAISAGGVIAAVAIIAILVLGVGVKVPTSTIIPPENVAITGVLSSYIQAGEKGAVLRANKDGSNVQMEIEFVPQKDFTPYLEKFFEDFKKNKGWQKDNCTQELYISKYSDTYSGIEIIFGDFKMKASDSISESALLANISTLTKMESGDTKKILFPIKLTGVTRKRRAKKVMESESVQIAVSLNYRINNNTLEAASMWNDYSAYLKIE
jgi:hypothetical protein